MKTLIIQTGRTTPCRLVPAETLEPDTPAPPPARTASTPDQPADAG